MRHAAESTAGETAAFSALRSMPGALTCTLALSRSPTKGSASVMGEEGLVTRAPPRPLLLLRLNEPSPSLPASSARLPQGDLAISAVWGHCSYPWGTSANGGRVAAGTRSAPRCRVGVVALHAMTRARKTRRRRRGVEPVSGDARQYGYGELYGTGARSRACSNCRSRLDPRDEINATRSRKSPCGRHLLIPFLSK